MTCYRHAILHVASSILRSSPELRFKVVVLQHGADIVLQFPVEALSSPVLLGGVVCAQPVHNAFLPEAVVKPYVKLRPICTADNLDLYSGLSLSPDDCISGTSEDV